jgi:hypothetical protein
MADPEAENLCQLWLVLHNLEVGLPEIYLVYNKFGENYWNMGKFGVLIKKYSIFCSTLNFLQFYYKTCATGKA